MTTEQVAESGYTNAVNMTQRFSRMMLGFVITFLLTCLVDVLKIYVKFDTWQKHRLLLPLQYFRVICLIDLVAITWLRFDHNGETCFCRFEIHDEHANACMKDVRVFIEVYILILWLLVLVGAYYFICVVRRTKKGKKGDVMNDKE